MRAQRIKMQVRPSLRLETFQSVFGCLFRILVCRLSMIWNVAGEICHRIIFGKSVLHVTLSSVRSCCYELIVLLLWLSSATAPRKWPDGRLEKSLRVGLMEMRIDYGPGYRIYYVRRGAEIVILLCAGDKRTQQQDIKRARELPERL